MLQHWDVVVIVIVVVCSFVVVVIWTVSTIFASLSSRS